MSPSSPSAAPSATAAAGYEIVRAQPEHLEEILKLYRETSDYHQKLDPHYYVRAGAVWHAPTSVQRAASLHDINLHRVYAGLVRRTRGFDSRILQGCTGGSAGDAPVRGVAARAYAPVDLPNVRFS
jgi:hypothetical protein